MPHPTVSSAVSLHSLSPTTFRSNNPIEGQGGGGIIGYGGFTIAFGLNAAFHSLSPPQRASLRLYSCLGTFLGPSNTTHHLTATVTELRNTRTFATRHVLISQPLTRGTASGKQGEEDASTPSRTIMSLTADFMLPEPVPGSFVQYAIKPMRAYSVPERSMTWEDLGAMAERHGVGRERVAAERAPMRHFEAKFEIRSPKEGFNGQSARALVPLSTKIEMDGRVETERVNAEWFRARERMGSYGE